MKTFLLIVLWWTLAACFIVAVWATLNAYGRRRAHKRNWGFERARDPKVIPFGRRFVCCEHDEQCELSGQPCREYLKAMQKGNLP
jgi:hypothetical protein